MGTCNCLRLWRNRAYRDSDYDISQLPHGAQLCHLVLQQRHFRCDNAVTSFVIPVFYRVKHVTNTPSHWLLHIPNNIHTKHLQAAINPSSVTYGG